jgi:hypothetical protein
VAVVVPPAPVRPLKAPPGNAALADVWERVQEAIIALPNYFRSETTIEGLAATDLFTLNSTLGATIEVQVVQTLNQIRDVWETANYKLHGFRRYEQVFPDVRFEVGTRKGGRTVEFGIELKGWYLFSKEGEPSFRYSVDPDACSDWDLLVVVPWHLHNVLSGHPVVLPPFIERAKYTAEKRNYNWTYEKKWQDTKASRDVKRPPDVSKLPPYPITKQKISDSAVSDGGRNFGRVARVGVMDDYVDGMLGQLIAGVPARSWIDFFTNFERPED